MSRIRGTMRRLDNNRGACAWRIYDLWSAVTEPHRPAR